MRKFCSDFLSAAADMLYVFFGLLVLFTVTGGVLVGFLPRFSIEIAATLGVSYDSNILDVLIILMPSLAAFAVMSAYLWYCLLKFLFRHMRRGRDFIKSKAAVLADDETMKRVRTERMNRKHEKAERKARKRVEKLKRKTEKQDRRKKRPDSAGETGQ